MMVDIAIAQTPVVLSNYFPESGEIDVSFQTSDFGFADPEGLAKIKDGKLAAAVGFVRYDCRDYSAPDASMKIEIFTLLDSPAAWSLLTLLRENPVKDGPPGDAFVLDENFLLLAQDRLFVRIQGIGITEELLRKASESVSSRIDRQSVGKPGLITHMPEAGYDTASLCYFPSASSYDVWTKERKPTYIDTSYDMEIAHASYSGADNQAGTIFLMKFPTTELAEDYFDGLAVAVSDVREGFSIFARHTGPLVAVLEGNFNPQSADELLASVKFGYSVRWDKGNQANVVWGVPTSILGAVVNSLIFSALAGIGAILLGTAIGAGRFAWRGYREKRSPELAENDPGFTQLRLR